MTMTQRPRDRGPVVSPEAQKAGAAAVIRIMAGKRGAWSDVLNQTEWMSGVIAEEAEYAIAEVMLGIQEGED